MNSMYIQNLITNIENTEICLRGSAPCDGYHEGVALLVDKFSWHKKRRTQLFFIGNGGSSAIASHMTADFMKNGGMNTYSLYDNAVTTCMGNDYGYEHIFPDHYSF